MNGIKTFPKGGVHPHGNKKAISSQKISSSQPIKNAHVPSMAVIAMSQHIGKQAECTVAVGDEIKEGMLVGKASGFVSANIHSPIPGIVKSITEIYLPHGVKTKAIVLEFQGEFERSGKAFEKKTWIGMSPEELNGFVADMGIVGLGGATFPTHVKYTIKPEQKIDSLVINGVECEPFLTADHRLMLEKPDEILEGIEIVKAITGIRNVYIGIEENKTDAISHLKHKIQEKKLDYTVVSLKVKYPQGDEKMLLKAILGREVPSGGLPIDVGAIVSNVGTVFAVYEAIVWRKPLTERVITISGSGVKYPSNLKVRIGTKISEIIEECGGYRGKPGKIVLGGPMMGFAIADPDMPVTKGVSGILVFNEKDSFKFQNDPCIRCGRCIRACPWNLMPTLMYKEIENQDYTGALAMGLMDCKECGSCAFVCPSCIPLVQIFKYGKLLSSKK
ncbi:MAG: electron transport complex subunit RsxC [Spirochaetaceae bacterium]|nr:MAG: electron transport complex subunit RsxC [Spirochaetaceae bacterium]